MSALLTTATALLLATATPPADAPGSNEQLRALLQQLTSDNDNADNDDLEAAPAPKLRSYKQTKKKVEKKAKEEPAAAEATRAARGSRAASQPRERYATAKRFSVARARSTDALARANLGRGQGEPGA